MPTRKWFREEGWNWRQLGGWSRKMVVSEVGCWAIVVMVDSISIFYYIKCSSGMNCIAVLGFMLLWEYIPLCLVRIYT